MSTCTGQGSTYTFNKERTSKLLIECSTCGRHHAPVVHAPGAVVEQRASRPQADGGGLGGPLLKPGEQFAEPIAPERGAVKFPTAAERLDVPNMSRAEKAAAFPLHPSGK